MAICGAAPSVASADTCTWTGASSASWNDAGNWSTCHGGGVPADGDTLVFPAGGANPVNTNDIAGLDLVTIQITGLGVGDLRYQVSGQAITLATSLETSGPGEANYNALVNLDITLAADVAISNQSSFPRTRLTGNIDLNGSTLTFNPGANIEVAGDVSGAGAVVLAAPGDEVVFFLGANTFTGALTIQSGLACAPSSGLGASGALNNTVVASGATLCVQGTPGTFQESVVLNGDGIAGTLGALSLGNGNNQTMAGPITLSSDSRIRVADADETLTLAGAIDGAGALRKTGLGRLILDGPLTYGGATLLDAGTLLINGPSASPVVMTGGVLGGTGTVGAVAANSGTIGPGVSPGIFSTDALTLGPGVTVDIELDGVTPGSGHDQLDVTGAVSLGGAILSVALGFSPPPNATFVIINNDGVDAVSGTFAGLAEGAMLNVNALDFQVTYVGGDGNDVALVLLTPVPTMTVWMLTILVIALMAIGALTLRTRPAMRS